MLFKQLIDQLKTVKKPEDISAELAQELIMAGISSYMGVVMGEEPNMEVEEAFDMARIMTLKQFDMILLDLEENDDFPDFDAPENELSPMSDPQFKADMQKAIEAYNKRVSK